MLGTRKQKSKPVLGTRKRGGLFGKRTRKEKIREAMVGEPVTKQRRRGFFSGLTGSRRSTRTGANPVTGHQRHPSLGARISGFGKRVMGSFKHRPGEKASGTRQMRGTSGRASGARRWLG